MTILTYYDKDYKKYGDALIQSAERFEYPFIVLQNQEVPEEIPHGFTIGHITYMPKSQWKPYILQKAIKNVKDKCVWVDADAIIQERLDLDWDFDIAICLRRHTDRVENRDIAAFAHISGFLNAGVIFFNNTEGAKKFTELWVNEMPYTTSGSDQEALTRALFQFTHYPDIGKLYEYDGMKLRTLDADIWNFMKLPQQPLESPKIIHYIKKGYHPCSTLEKKKN